MTFLWLAILAHVIADFVVQTDNVAKSKRQLEWQGFLKHGLVIFLSTFIVIHFYGIITAFKFSFLTALLHIAFDYLKELLLNKSEKGWLPVISLLIDQVFHIYIIVLLGSKFTVNLDSNIINFYSILLPTVPIAFPVKEQLQNLFQLDKCIFTTIMYIYTTFGGAVLIRMVLDYVIPKNTYASAGGEFIIVNPANQTGRYIGILERAIILTLVLYGSLPAVAFVLTAKSIARFNELNNKDFAEYYLIGTLGSASIAVVGGLVLQSIIPIFRI